MYKFTRYDAYSGTGSTRPQLPENWYQPVVKVEEAGSGLLCTRESAKNYSENGWKFLNLKQFQKRKIQSGPTNTY